MIARATTLVLLAACSSPEKPPVTTQPPKPSQPATPPAPESQRRATVRIDAEPGGKRFQGVWLEHADGTKWVIAYRPLGFWKPFQDQEVIVTGHCYSPYGQAIGATHYHVETMRFHTPKRGVGPLLEVGPEVKLKGKLSKVDAPKGSKREGSAETRFLGVDGTSYKISGIDDEKDLAKLDKTFFVKARSVEPDMSWVAQTGGPALWIIDVDVDENDDPRFENAPMTCPEST
jgi:hypothetical protein